MPNLTHLLSFFSFSGLFVAEKHHVGSIVQSSSVAQSGKGIETTHWKTFFDRGPGGNLDQRGVPPPTFVATHASSFDFQWFWQRAHENEKTQGQFSDGFFCQNGAVRKVGPGQPREKCEDVNVKMRVWVRTGCGTLGAHVYKKNIIRREIMKCTNVPRTTHVWIKDTRYQCLLFYTIQLYTCNLWSFEFNCFLHISRSTWYS